ncbi:uncharacterized protein LOC143490983 [Brachyhypopomus gauderio]|uniref:uncharacterized protein LOC143490983 n=1 Tax=Brachyhypopomus gauderio TaxID=698409 RepID=UPI004041DA4B
MRQYLILLFVLPVTELSASEQIPCQVRTENNVQYLKIIWYKVITSSDSLVGLVMKDIRKNSTILYKPANLSYQIGDDFSLLIPQDSVAEVCETYRCSLWPHVGHRILKSDYSRPQGCQNADVYSAVQTMEAPLNNFIFFNFSQFWGEFILRKIPFVVRSETVYTVSGCGLQCFCTDA